MTVNAKVVKVSFRESFLDLDGSSLLRQRQSRATGGAEATTRRFRNPSKFRCVGWHDAPRDRLLP